MKKARISELRDRLSYYLRIVRRGEPVLVCDRDRVIARIEPIGSSGSRDEDDAIADLERRGVIRRPDRKLPEDWFRRRPVVGVDVVAALLEEREEGR